MTKTTRREFLKVFASMAVLALPRPKGGGIAPEVQQNDKALLAGIERASTKLIDNANFDVEVDEPGVTIFDMLDDFNKTVMAQADAFEQCERAFDHAFFTSWDVERALDSCECAPMEWHVEHKQCEAIE